jgi:hypothetical protein
MELIFIAIAFAGLLLFFLYRKLTSKRRIRRSANARGWQIVSITNESNLILRTTKYRVVYTTMESPEWQQTFCNPGLFGVIWFENGFWPSRLP